MTDTTARTAEKLPTAFVLIATVIALAFGVFLGSALSHRAAHEAVAAETSAEPTPAKTITKTETVKRTPKACKDALKAADDLTEAHEKMHNASAHALLSTASADNAGMTEAARITERLADDITEAQVTYDTAADKCRATK